MRGQSSNVSMEMKLSVESPPSESQISECQLDRATVVKRLEKLLETPRGRYFLTQHASQELAEMQGEAPDLPLLEQMLDSQEGRRILAHNLYPVNSEPINFNSQAKLQNESMHSMPSSQQEQTSVADVHATASQRMQQQLTIKDLQLRNLRLGKKVDKREIMLLREQVQRLSKECKQSKQQLAKAQKRLQLDSRQEKRLKQEDSTQMRQKLKIIEEKHKHKLDRYNELLRTLLQYFKAMQGNMLALRQRYDTLRKQGAPQVNAMRLRMASMEKMVLQALAKMEKLQKRLLTLRSSSDTLEDDGSELRTMQRAKQDYERDNILNGYKHLDKLSAAMDETPMDRSTQSRTKLHQLIERSRRLHPELDVLRNSIQSMRAELEILWKQHTDKVNLRTTREGAGGDGQETVKSKSEYSLSL